ncbi:hypothetical protein AB0L70_02615 [Kribbella sp. NPDC051952]|uniref:hypothetical protein n=1 Tax=Kribbella sp. NPDC051952 TaxID=3154851 RepID=UPI003430AEAA
MSYPPPVNAAPNYGQPPRKNRAGLVIVLLVVLLVGVIGAGGFLAYRLVSDKFNNSSTPDPATAPVSSPTPKRSVPVQPTRPVQPRTTKPTVVKPPVTKPPATTPAGSAPELAARFVAQLNANNSTGAAALACQSSKQLVPLLMGQFLRPPTRLTTGTLIAQSITFVMPVSGTTKGSSVTGVIVMHKIAPEPLCVRAFTITPG